MLFCCLNWSRLENTCKCLYHVTKRSHGTEISFGICSNQLSLPHPHSSHWLQWSHLRMELKPILEWQNCGQWELCWRRHRRVGATLRLALGLKSKKVTKQPQFHQKRYLLRATNKPNICELFHKAKTEVAVGIVCNQNNAAEIILFLLFLFVVLHSLKKPSCLLQRIRSERHCVFFQKIFKRGNQLI